MADLDRLFAVIKKKCGRLTTFSLPMRASSRRTDRPGRARIFDRLFAINVKGLFHRAEGPAAHARRSFDHTELVNCVEQGNGGITVYGIPKRRCILRPNLHHRPKERKIRVDSLSPGPIDTPDHRGRWV